MKQSSDDHFFLSHDYINSFLTLSCSMHSLLILCKYTPYNSQPEVLDGRRSRVIAIHMFVHVSRGARGVAALTLFCEIIARDKCIVECLDMC